MEFFFVGWQKADGIYSNNINILDAYKILQKIWCKETCAPRMQHYWNTNHPYIGQCSITAFLLQDFFGGKVLGIPLEDEHFHCYNEIDGIVFDLTSEQFEKLLNYEDNVEQFRHDHFLKKEKFRRYEILKKKFLYELSKNNL